MGVASASRFCLLRRYARWVATVAMPDLWTARAHRKLVTAVSEIWTGGAFTTDQKLVVLGQGSTGKVRADRDGRPKLSQDGRPTYSTGCTVLVKDESGELVTARGTVTVHVVEPLERYGSSAVHPTVYTTDGTVWVTPYVSNGWSALSIIAERLVPHKVLGEGASK